MLLEQLWREMPNLEAAIRQQVVVSDREQTWALLRQLMAAAAPSTGAALPGGIIDQVSDIAAVFGLADRLVPDLAGPNNPGLWVGVAKEGADLVVAAPLDRLTFRVKQLIDDRTAELYPICVAGLPEEMAQAPAQAFRYDAQRARLGVSARGQLVPRDGALFFRAEHGTVSWIDAITLDLVPRRQRDWVRGSGLDNAAGVLETLALGAVLRQVEEALLEHNRRCLLVFPDRRDFSPATLINRAAGGSLQPALGTILVEGQIVDAEHGPQYEAGMAYTSGSERRCGMLVPVNYQQLAHDLELAFEQVTSGVAQFTPASAACAGQQSGMVSSQRVLGVMGPPLSRPHAGQEIVHLADVEAGVWWLGAFVALALNLVPEVASRYALGR